MSGLTVGPDGNLWAIPEERRELLRIDRTTGAVDAFPIVGMAEGLEAEALTWRPGPGGGEFVVGTETDGPSRPSDDLVILDFDGRVAHVREMVRCPYGLWHMQAEHNRGVEGLCSVGRDLVVAAEITGEIGGRRFAPLGRRQDDGRWDAYELWLTSPTGKLAGLDCHAGADGSAHVYAIERHFGVLRILRFVLPPHAENGRTGREGSGAATHATEITPEIVLNLDRWVAGREPSPNFEGIALLGGQIALLNDNQFRGIQSGPSELWFIDLPD